MARKKKLLSSKIKMTPEKAGQILKDGTIYGKPITPNQRGLFGVIYSKGKTS